MAGKAYGGTSCTTSTAAPSACVPGVYWSIYKLTSSGIISGPLAPALLQGGLVYNPQYGLAYPNVAALADGTAWLVYTYSGAGGTPAGQPAYPGVGVTQLTKAADRDSWTAGGIVLVKPGLSPVNLTVGSRTSPNDGTYYR